jgi:hypothetical protein
MHSITRIYNLTYINTHKHTHTNTNIRKQIHTSSIQQAFAKFATCPAFHVDLYLSIHSVNGTATLGQNT